MLNKMSFKTKIFALVLFQAFVSVFIGFTGILGLQKVHDYNELVTTIGAPKIELAQEMYLDYLKIRIALRTLGLNHISKPDAEKAIEESKAAIAKFESSKEKYLALPPIEGQAERYKKVEDAWLPFKETGGKALALAQNLTPENQIEIQKIFFVDCPAHAQTFMKAMNELLDFHEEFGNKNVALAKLEDAHAKSSMKLALALGVLLAMAFGYLFATKMARDLMKVETHIAGAAKDTTAASIQLSTASQSLASGASQVAASLQETVASLEEVVSMVKTNSKHALDASSLSSKTTESAKIGSQQLQELTNAMGELNQSSKKIGEITVLIDDIAFQTNLLALNAAVEAARAGEQGKGFAVVAEAVRSLAQRASVAAKDINVLIQEIVVKTQNGVELSTRGNEALAAILSQVSQVAQLNQEIAGSSEQQSMGISQVSQALNDIDRATQSNASNSEEIAASSEEMSSQAKLLLNMSNSLSILTSGSQTNTEVEAPYLSNQFPLKRVA